MKFTKSTPETDLPDFTWYICMMNGMRKPMRFEKYRGDLFGVHHVWVDVKGQMWLDDVQEIHFLNDLENEEFKNFDLAQ